MCIPKQKPEKMWKGFKGIRSIVEIKKGEKEITWESDEEESAERKENDLYMASITTGEGKEISEEEVSKYMTTVDEMEIEQDIECCFTEQTVKKECTVEEQE